MAKARLYNKKQQKIQRPKFLHENIGSKINKFWQIKKKRCKKSHKTSPRNIEPMADYLGGSYVGKMVLKYQPPHTTAVVTALKRVGRSRPEGLKCRPEKSDHKKQPKGCLKRRAPEIRRRKKGRRLPAISQMKHLSKAKLQPFVHQIHRRDATTKLTKVGCCNKNELARVEVCFPLADQIRRSLIYLNLR